MSKLGRLLIIEDREADIQAYARALSLEYSVSTARSLAEAKRLDDDGIAVVVSDIRLDEADRGNRDGLEFLRWHMNERPHIPVIMMTAYNDMDLAVQALNLGAEYFLRKPVNLKELRTACRALAEKAQLRRRYTIVEQRLRHYEPWDIIGDSEPIRQVKNAIKKAATDGHITVLVTGASGTGKELVARALHRQGVRHEEPFVAESLKVREGEAGLLESLLFGHEKGAFTDAQERRTGVFEQADGGVLFLDEIGELDASTQAKLLRVLESRTLRRMGGQEDLSIDLQLVAATNRDLEAAVREGGFREDLYFRLNVFRIHMPLLREIPQDIPALAEHFLASLREQGRTAAEQISGPAMALLQAYGWPGNARELRNYIERAALFAETVITPEHLPETVTRGRTPFAAAGSAPPVAELPEDGIDFDAEQAKHALQLVEAALRTAEGRKGEAWKLLHLRDRFDLLAKVKSIAADHPGIWADFPYLAQQYPRIAGDT